ncbi:2-oxoglutarate and iron-dependent oxygenase JMJD4 homolog [Eupeodes corollae]|uniref:2-oxoglutarate and iron-dependent oxygenase JMJD4 homolog n=1 Tax=Eupeodes corollae TaxID=290404 RepID=UPI0024931FB1|nr:2-oxoglutarate and iron-dependent oxygenase JMJD4 homolog [Eupeodes corollae]
MSTFLLDLKLKSPLNQSQINENLIPRIKQTDLTYNDFYWNYMNANWPVILTSVSNEWECRRQWTIQTTTSNNDTTEINFKYLKQKIGNCLVPVANCSKEYYNSHEKCEMKFFDYLDQWQMSVFDNNHNLYLKDWHLKELMPDYDFYRVPKYFASDWLNEYLIDRKLDDYRFVYMGPRDSWTPFHADVFGSYSWSTNIAGRKKWLLLPPQEEQKLTDSLGNLPFRITEDQLNEKNVKFFTIIQTENESIFVPSGWYHQVWNLTDTISINHNWFNACNAPTIWRNLAQCMQRVIHEIEDCRQMDNFEEHCQTMLRASFGINYSDFLNILEHIIAKRLHQSYHNHNNNNIEKNILFDTFTLSDFHVRYDLAVIADVLEAIKNDDVVQTRAELCDRCKELAEQTKGFKCE